jgi:transposase InsO family protein
MAGEVFVMKVMSVVMAFVAGEAMNVSAQCRQCGVTRQTFYKYVARFRAEGLAGFEERSRRPHSSPAATSITIEDAIVELRKDLEDHGLDHGALTIQSHLTRDRRFARAAPSVATVHRILVRRGFVTPQPRKRPKNSWCRFEAPAPNECWQIDATDWEIKTGIVRIFNIIDDHSRLACRSRAVTEATGTQAWATFCEAAQRWGLPAAVLSDNGLCFSGKLRGFEVLFEANLRDGGIRPITGRGYHPQTTGKVERFQQTLKKWLRHQDRHHGLARTLAELQDRLDEFCDYYNTQRPHQGIGRITPLSRWTANPPSQPGESLPHPEPRPRNQVRTLTVDSHGIVNLTHAKIAVGAEWIGTTVTVISDDHHATILCDHQLVRHLRIDPTRRYQPNRRPRGGPRRPRHLNS